MADSVQTRSIDQDVITTIFPASRVLSKTSDAEFEIEKKAVAHAINTAANTGETSVLYQSPMSDRMMDVLRTTNKYKVVRVGQTHINCPWLISWEA